MIVTLPWPAPALWPNFRSRSHWAKTKAVKKARDYAFWVAKEAGVGICAGDVPIGVHITFHPPGRYKYDRDNMLASLKPFFDGIADALKVNDNLFRFPAPDVAEVVKGGRVIVSIDVAEGGTV